MKEWLYFSGLVRVYAMLRPLSVASARPNGRPPPYPESSFARDAACDLCHRIMGGAQEDRYRRCSRSERYRLRGFMSPGARSRRPSRRSQGWVPPTMRQDRVPFHPLRAGIGDRVASQRRANGSTPLTRRVAAPRRDRCRAGLPETATSAWPGCRRPPWHRPD